MTKVPRFTSTKARNVVVATGVVAVAALVLAGCAASPDQHRGGGGASPTQHSPSSHSPSSSTPSTPTRTSASSPPADQVELTGFRIVDLTFIGPEDQWALGIANCLRGPGRCP